MATQYDSLAEKYQRVMASPLLKRQGRIMEYTLHHHLGDISNKAVLDLACGHGRYTRKMKQMGAGYTIGVDISEGMLELARRQEAEEPLGIEYRHSAVQELGHIGDFDVVIAVWLLNYAPNREQLLQMTQTIYDNLKPDQRFLTICSNPQTREPGYPHHKFGKYGYRVEMPELLREGSKIKITAFTADDEVQFHNHYFSQATTEWALKTAGFKTVTWHKVLLPPEIEQEDGRDFWDFYINASPGIVVEAQK